VVVPTWVSHVCVCVRGGGGFVIVWNVDAIDACADALPEDLDDIMDQVDDLNASLNSTIAVVLIGNMTQDLENEDIEDITVVIQPNTVVACLVSLCCWMEPTKNSQSVTR